MSERNFARGGWAALALGIGLLAALGSSPARADDQDTKRDESRVRKIVINDDRRDGDSEDSGYLGVRVQDLTRSLRRAKSIQGVDGALVNSVEDGSPADKAGIQKGDVIVEVNRTTTSDASDLTRTVRDLRPGSKVDVVVIREGNRKTLPVTVGSRPEDMGPGGSKTLWWRGEGPPEPSDMPDMRDMPAPPRMPRGQALQRQREMQQQLQDIQDQLSRLREEDLAQLQEELRALREELHRSGLLRDDSRDRRDRSKTQGDDD
jgi:membrane-associated protease RseP (regulator of RpoE activity)